MSPAARRAPTARRRSGRARAFLLVLLGGLLAAVGCDGGPEAEEGAAAGGGEASSGSAPVEVSPGTPVVFVTVDTLRWDHLGRNGHERDATPFIDRFATEGAYFAHAYAQSSWTLPSMLSMMSSLPPSAFGIAEGVEPVPRRGREGGKHASSAGEGVVMQAEYFSDEYVTLPEVLAEQGYATAGFSTNGHLIRRQGFAQGFEVFDESSCMWGSAACVFGAARQWLEGHLEEAPRRPFLLWIHLFDPHFDRWQRPPIYRPAEGYGTMFGEERLEGPAARTRRDYDRELRYTDDQLAAFVRTLKARELLDEAVFVLAADHGEEFNEKGRWGHSKALTNTLVRVPLLIRLPHGQGAGAEIRAPVANLDVAPTLLDLLGVEAPEAFEGQSLRPLLEGRPFEARPIQGETRRFGLELRFYVDPERGRKLVVDARSGRHRLYDLTGDPRETHDLSRRERRLAAALHGELRSRVEAMEERRVESTAGRTVPEEELEKLRALGYVD